MKKIFILMCAVASAVFAKPEPYDKIVAVVDGEAILYSDLMETMYQIKQQPGFATADGVELQKKVLDRLIDNKIILAKARLDTMALTLEEEDQMVEQHIQNMAMQYRMSPTQMEAALQKQYGMSVPEFKKMIKPKLVEQQILQRVQGKYVGFITVTPQEVQDFFTEYKDSLPKQYNSVKMSVIKKEIKPSVAILDSVKNIADSLISQLDKGAPFDTLAEQFSQDYTTGFGGDLGYFKKGAHDPLFDRVAFSLQQGRYTSVPVKTEEGFHIIKQIQRKDSEIQAAHILLKTIPTSADTSEARNLLDSLKAAAKDDDFNDLAKKYSDDKETIAKAGLLGWFEKSKLSGSAAEAAELAVGNVSDPVLENKTWVIYKVDQKESERILTLEDDWAVIENLAKGYKSQDKLKTYIDKWRNLVYVEVLDSVLKVQK